MFFSTYVAFKSAFSFNLQVYFPHGRIESEITIISVTRYKINTKTALEISGLSKRIDRILKATSAVPVWWSRIVSAADGPKQANDIKEAILR